MNREFHKWYSNELHRDMELLVFGHAGAPMLVFPTSMGKFYEYEDRGMIGAIEGKIENGKWQIVCIDSVDSESWYNKNVHPRDRVLRHNQYEQYIINEVVPFIRTKNPAQEVSVTGCSFGGYHAMNFSLKHPEMVSNCVSMSAMFDVHDYLNGYYDEDCYFNCPVDYLPNLNDEWYLHMFRTHTKFVLATGEHDMCMDANIRLSRIMNSKSIPHLLDVWGDGMEHDWSWWQKMAQKYF
jgi:esterase/lipase superfamily enzyme